MGGGGRSGHIARAESGRWPSLPRDRSATPARTLQSSLRMGQLALGFPAASGWGRSLANVSYGVDKIYGGCIFWGPPCVCSGGNWASPSLSRVKLSGPDRSIPKSRGGPGRRPATPTISARPGGGRGVGGTCTEGRRNGMTAWPGGPFPELARCSQRVLMAPLCILWRSSSAGERVV